MRSFDKIGNLPSGQPLPADDITELHASRILMLLKLCGISNRVDGLTKLAKLDFFVRYPDALNTMAEHLGKQERSASQSVESPMLRHHYGPWDKRYYHVLAFLESRELIRVRQSGNSYIFELTEQGNTIAAQLTKQTAFLEQTEQMRRVKKLLGSKTGNAIKKLIYEVFKEEVAERPRGEIIR